jgi:hypothetical protein
MKSLRLPAVAALLLSAFPVETRAQDSLPPTADTLAARVPDTLAARQEPQSGDSISYARAPVSPMGAFWRSLPVPMTGEADRSSPSAIHRGRRTLGGRRHP